MKNEIQIVFTDESKRTKPLRGSELKRTTMTTTETMTILYYVETCNRDLNGETTGETKGKWFDNRDDAEEFGELSLTYVGDSYIVHKVKLDADDKGRYSEESKPWDFDINDEVTHGQHSGEDIEDAVILQWSYETYVGYSTKFQGLRFGNRKETEFDLHEERDSKNKVYENVIVTAEEMDVLSDNEQCELIAERINAFASNWTWGFGFPPDAVHIFLGIDYTDDNE
jgi:hypothetical protein